MTLSAEKAGGRGCVQPVPENAPARIRAVSGTGTLRARAYSLIGRIALESDDGAHADAQRGDRLVRRVGMAAAVVDERGPVDVLRERITHRGPDVDAGRAGNRLGLAAQGRTLAAAARV